jgi:hypothetical protein
MTFYPTNLRWSSMWGPAQGGMRRGSPRKATRSWRSSLQVGCVAKVSACTRIIASAGLKIACPRSLRRCALVSPPMSSC